MPTRARGWVGLTARHQRADLIRAGVGRGLLQPEGRAGNFAHWARSPNKCGSRAAGRRARSGINLFADIFDQDVADACDARRVGLRGSFACDGWYRRICKRGGSLPGGRQRGRSQAARSGDAAAFTRKRYQIYSSLYPALKQAFQSHRRTGCLRVLTTTATLSLPVPLDRIFTYELPLTLRHRVKPGCRVVAPLGARKLTGVVLRVHAMRIRPNAREVAKSH